jgi:hypothetical protein
MIEQTKHKVVLNKSTIPSTKLHHIVDQDITKIRKTHKNEIK